MSPDRPDRVGEVFAALGKSVCYVVLFLGLQVMVMLPAAVSIIVGAIAEGTVMDGAAIASRLSDRAMMLTLISGLLTIAVVLAFYLIRRKKLSDALMLRPVPAPTLLTGASLMPGLYLVVITVLSLLPEAWLDSYSQASAGVEGGTVVGVVSVAVVAPVVEEFIFRGLVMNRLSRVMPGWLAVLLSAAVFGACHGHPVWSAYAFALGAVFGFIDLRAGSIWPSILGHAAFNLIGQILSFVPETEGGTENIIMVVVLLAVGIALPLVNRRAIAALFRPVPRALPGQGAELSAQPGAYEYDPWDE